MAIWPVIVPKLEQRRRGVEMLSLPNVNSLSPGKKAQEVEAEVGLFDSGASNVLYNEAGNAVPGERCKSTVRPPQI